MLHPELLDFQRRLESVGIVTAQHADHVCVRLPLLTSVRVRYDGARLSFDARSGAIGRTRGTALTFLASLAAVSPTLLAGAPLAQVVGVATLVVMASVFDALRYVVTESAISRVTALWSSRPAAGTIDALGAGPAQPVERAAGETVRAPRHVE